MRTQFRRKHAIRGVQRTIQNQPDRKLSPPERHKCHHPLNTQSHEALHLIRLICRALLPHVPSGLHLHPAKHQTPTLYPGAVTLNCRITLKQKECSSFKDLFYKTRKLRPSDATQLTTTGISDPGSLTLDPTFVFFLITTVVLWLPKPAWPRLGCAHLLSAM